ncbi:substrate-binding periplasmic protein [Mesorhizobium sp. ES1-4]|uniref:substrate-binding periplasmic protein n=1 Tax=Mesorhizobium sp. ES1-4 TaxID=2876627 RepID=UPI001CC914AC|nr:transporter substrate-binding domain-containing protein [Mesorhizobium sp. ES1-4]MBZ9798435.1 transporter substrate-binding domain-containing protein [Mesorhizobium sp. ES1-4]
MKIRTTSMAAVATLACAFVPGTTMARAGDLLDDVKASHEIVVGTANEAPLSFIDPKTHEGAGALIDILKEALKREGIDAKATMVGMPFSSLIPAVQSGRIQLMGDAMYVRPQRREQMDFTNGIFFNPESLDVQAGNPKNLHKISDLCGHPAGTYQGTSYLETLKKASAACPADKPIDVHTYPTIQHVLADLAAGRIDAAVVDSSLSAYALKQTPSLGFELVADFVPEDKADTMCAFGAAKGQSDKFLDAFNKQYATMLADGTAAKIFANYGLSPTDFFLKP